MSYGDFITLMFALFTTLYAISVVEAEKLADPEEMPTEVSEPVVASPPDPPSPIELAVAERSRELSELRARLQARLAPGIASRLVAVRLDGRGLVISLHEAGAFATGSAELSPVARSLVETVASAVAPLGNIVRVEGHTDDVPIATTRYRSNWELSTARATNVVTHLVEEAGMPASRFAIAGYGQYRPLVSNDTEANRARNRRVDIVVLSSRTTSNEEPAIGAGEGQ